MSISEDVRSASAPAGTTPAAPVPVPERKATWRRVGGSRWFLVPLVFVLVVLLWQFLAKVVVDSQLLLPTPLSTWQALWQALTTGPYWGEASVYYNFWSTAKVCVVGFALGSALGIVIGIVLAQSRIVMTALGPYITAFQSLPRVAIAPLVVVWFGQGFTSNTIITATVVFLPVLVSTVSGLAMVDRGLLEMLHGFSASRWQTLRKVSLWAALPSIFSGLQVGIVFSVVGAIVAEWVGANVGLGVLLLQAQYNFDVSRTFALLVLLAVLGIILNGIVVIAQKYAVYWLGSDADRQVIAKVATP